MTIRQFCFFISILFLFACGTSKSPFIKNKDWEKDFPTSNKEKLWTLWLIGDTGELDDEINIKNMTVDGMVSMMDLKDTNAIAIFLGDNVYPYGLAENTNPRRKHDENILMAQLDPLTSFEGHIYFIPGNHDWNKHKKGGRQAILRQENFIENYYEQHTKIDFVPDNACGDPYVLEVNEDVTIVFLDSQWWLHDWRLEEGINTGCEIKERSNLLAKIEEIIIAHKNDQLIFALHHPLKTNGPHGGKFPVEDHIFPLRHFGVWFPLPILGSAYPMYRRFAGSTQDVTNKINQSFVYRIEELAKKWDVKSIFASGHEHGLQYFESNNIKYVVSGSGGKTNYIQKGGGAYYIRSKRGFAKIDFYQDNESWIEFYTINQDNVTPILEYRRRLY
jgi:UDP-2,3-diacylglucosamine pyrophosphatase LpxH